MNFQVTVLKVLVSYPDGFAMMDEIKRDMPILATSGREWADRTQRLATRVPDLDVFSQGLVERQAGGWRITAKGRTVLEFMEARSVASEPVQQSPAEEEIAAALAAVPLLRSPAQRAKRRRERRERLREARERARANTPWRLRVQIFMSD